MKRAARFRVTPELLKQALKMPDDANVIRLYEDPHRIEPHWWIMVESEELPEVAEGAAPIEISPNIEVDYDDQGTAIAYRWDWGIPNENR
jgi:hypothetical protein